MITLTLKFIMASPTKIALLCGLLAMFCLGVYDVLKNYEDNACEMTYMFEMPEYMASNESDINSVMRSAVIKCRVVGPVKCVMQCRNAET